MSDTMMNGDVRMDWGEMFALPAAARVDGRRIPKTVLAAQGELTRLEQKKLDRIRRLEHIGTISRSTTRILPVSNEEYDIQSVLYLRAEVRGVVTSELSELLHKSFPNPTVIVQENEGAAIVSASLIRRSRAERGAFVMEDWRRVLIGLPLNARDNDFIDAVAFPNLPQDDLSSYVRGFMGAIECAQAASALGFFPMLGPSGLDRKLEMIRRLNVATETLHGLETARKDKSKSLNETAKIRVEMREAQTEVDRLCEQITDECGWVTH